MISYCLNLDRYIRIQFCLLFKYVVKTYPQWISNYTKNHIPSIIDIHQYLITHKCLLMVGNTLSLWKILWAARSKEAFTSITADLLGMVCRILKEEAISYFLNWLTIIIINHINFNSEIEQSTLFRKDGVRQFKFYWPTYINHSINAKSKTFNYTHLSLCFIICLGYRISNWHACTKKIYTIGRKWN